MMTKKGPTKIINFMTPRAGVLVLGRVHMLYSDSTLGHKSEKLKVYV